MSLEKELHAVSHLKGLINCENISGWQEHGTTITLQKTHLKIPILLHTEPRPYLFSVGSVQQQKDNHL